MSGTHNHEHGVGPLLKYSDPSEHDIDETARYPLMAQAIRQLLVEKGVVTNQEVREYIEFIDSRGTAVGAKIVARAWNDPEYKKRLLTDGTAAVAEFDIPMAGTELVVVENSATVHNLVVCTLCSCYPRTILGLPPDWYKSKTYRARTVKEPRTVLREFGTELSIDTTVRVHDSNADMRYLVLPARPEATEGWNEAQLAELVTRDCMIGVGLPVTPSAWIYPNFSRSPLSKRASLRHAKKSLIFRNLKIQRSD
jgi:nitrile hydratase alpha subunit